MTEIILTAKDIETLKSFKKFKEELNLDESKPSFCMVLMSLNQLNYSYEYFCQIMKIEMDDFAKLLLAFRKNLHEDLENTGLSEELKVDINNIYNSMRFYIHFNDVVLLSDICFEKEGLLNDLENLQFCKDSKKILSIFFLAFDKFFVWAQAINILNERIKSSINVGQKLKKQSKHVVDIHKKGAEARKMVFESKKAKAYELYEKGNYHSYAKCARDIYLEVGVSDPRTVSNWLSEKYSKKKK
ncbi:MULTISPECIES: hypothetical protein [Acinetobacter calcoaceticus/baumannii complex]|uniref:hypothetical protein n=1 Tax=Acinetobacter calcoaceticus/baumannii complex TaxID=909768 RepID=UPI000A5778EE|nr:MULTISPECIES: hypothetical protein [Acinetobacter calcoaceticus/baumannii complex]MBP4977510.1 hypothetical protein [Acinetobacter baumannii]THD99565.1 hypothetical protein E5F90_02360 [Acinetobacter baumannii]HAV4296952.1 hypothetical protein [Acinetobacter baumannii]HCI7175277.1 hypothetical protein [Acinetobacter baumannii]HCJ1340885.1 hypothetical protein [Acinetobacter baumannii]